MAIKIIFLNHWGCRVDGHLATCPLCYNKFRWFCNKCAYRISFHVSGTPGKHQWMQSAKFFGSDRCFFVNSLPFRSPYTDVWASFRYSDSWVMFKNVTSIFNSCRISWTIFMIVRLEPVPQYEPWMGYDSLKQFSLLPGFHSQLLQPKNLLWLI